MNNNHSACRLIALPLLIIILATTGCSRLAMSDGSLDYQKARLLPPITLPEGRDSRQIYPLYALPDKQAKSKQLNLRNAKGNRYKLPRPNTVNVISTESTTATTDTQNTQMKATASANTQTAYYNKALIVEEGVPILQVQASTEQTRQKLVSVLQRSNYRILNDGQAQLGKITISHANLPAERMLQYRNLGSVTSVVVTTTDSRLADAAESHKILSDMSANW